LLVRAINAIAFGVQPAAFTAGRDRNELEKRLASELMGAHPCVFLDNVNGTALKSDALASAITECPSRVRLLGTNALITLNSAAFIVVTGNGLSMTEDLARRFILCQLDARCDDPEERPFSDGFLEGVQRRRDELLSAALTIYRWGRQNASNLSRGVPLGGFATWAEWCRDPLLSLGCSDPVARMRAMKALDPQRLSVIARFERWHEFHGERPVKAAELSPELTSLIDPHNRGRQYVVAYLLKLKDTRVRGWRLTIEPGVGDWGASTYAVKRSLEGAQQ